MGNKVMIKWHDFAWISQALEHRLDLSKGGVGKLSLDVIEIDGGEFWGLSFHPKNWIGWIICIKHHKTARIKI